MSSSIIGDAKYQELNMSFTFDEQEEGKMTVNAVADQIPYQLELFANPDLDFEDLKNILLSKQFKLVSKTPEIMKIKIAFTFFEFKNVEKMTLNTLKQTITELSSKLKEKSHKIVVLEEVVKELRKDFDSMTTRMADFKRKNDENQHQMVETQKIYQEQVNEILDSLRSQAEKERRQKESQAKTVTVLETDLRKCGEKINSLEKASTENLKKLEGAVNDQREKQKMHKLEESIREVFSKVQQIEEIEFIQKHIQQIEQKKMEIAKQNSEYFFSSQHKTHLITLSNNNSKVTNSKQNITGDDLALVEGAVFRNGSCIRFKIETIGYAVAVGLALRNVVEKNSYQLKNFKEIGHGCFLIFQVGNSYSHSHKEQNCLETDFLYDVGDVIRVETKEEALLFVNETKKKEQTLKLSLTEDEWKQACFGAVLVYKNDSISIM